MAGILDLMNNTQAGFERGRARGRESSLGKLYSQAFTAPEEQRPQIFGGIAQMGGIGAASSVQQAISQMDEGRRNEFGRIVAAFEALPQEQKSAAYPEVARRAQGFGIPVPQGPYQDSYGDGMRSIAMAYGSGSANPSGYQEFDMLARDAHLSPEDRALAARRALYLDRRPSNAAIKYEGIEGDDGRTRQFALDPNSPNAQQIGGDQFGFLSSLGAQVTSGQRSPQDNARVDGVPNSYHLSGQARDILPPTNPQQAAAIRQQAAANGLEVIDEGDHWHLEPRPQDGGVNPLVSRRPEDEAAAKAAAEESAKLGLLDDRGTIEAENARQKKVAELAAAREDARITNMPKARSALAGAKRAGESVNRAILQALPNINVWTAGYAGQPLSKVGGSAAADLRASLDTIEANIAFDRLQQMRESSPTGGALGSVSERELTLLGSAITSLKQSQSPAQLRSNLQFLQQQYDKVLKQLEADFEADFGGASVRPGSYGSTSPSAGSSDPLGIL